MAYNKEEIEGITSYFTAWYSSWKLPINFSAILQKTKKVVRMYAAEFDNNDISWITKRIGTEYEIYVNRDQAETRQRFSKAHEFGHVVLWHLDNEYEKVDFKMRKNGWYTKEELQEEKEANLFASALLMPAHLIQELYNAGKSVYEMAMAFGVSDQAIRIRLFNLWYTVDE